MNLNYKDEHVTAELTIETGTVETECLRQEMQGDYWVSYSMKDGKEIPNIEKPKDWRRHYIIFPNMVCCTTGTIKVDGQEVDWHEYDVWKKLHATLYILWRDATTKVNPYLWGAGVTTKEENEKKT